MPTQTEIHHSVVLSEHHIHIVLSMAADSLKEEKKFYYSRRVFLRHLYNLLSKGNRGYIDQYYPELIEEISK